MARRWRGSIGGLALLAVLAACGRTEGTPEATPDGAADRPVRLRFEDRPEPDVFSREGPATRDGPNGSAGLWASVVGLKRPERGLVENTDTGAKVVVALFVAREGAEPAIRLSGEAAEAIGIGNAPAAVRITALRREPQIDTTKGRF